MIAGNTGMAKIATGMPAPTFPRLLASGAMIEKGSDDENTEIPLRSPGAELVRGFL